MTEKHEILMSRVMSVVLAMGALIIALYIKKRLQCAHVCLVLLRGGGRPALPGGPVLEKSHQPGHHICHDRRLCGMCGLETGRQSLGLGETVPGALVCGILLVAVSLATCKKHPCRMA